MKNPKQKSVSILPRNFCELLSYFYDTEFETEVKFGRFKVDFYSENIKLAFEYDGIHHYSNIQKIESDKRKNDLVEFTYCQTYRGPAINFHQCFNPSNMKDLGWRQWWLKNKSKNLVKEPKQFQSIMRHYMNNQENTKNLYL